ncbi:hypothetical protein DL95DRAFT_411735 [Leptodontidium sp. 2 PMI_412]|nr:hypothetical protein DL95DRAFT_411735 [Leptodontidium sp. 2 PMI_412]
MTSDAANQSSSSKKHQRNNPSIEVLGSMALKSIAKLRDTAKNALDEMVSDLVKTQQELSDAEESIRSLQDSLVEMENRNAKLDREREKYKAGLSRSNAALEDLRKELEDVAAFSLEIDARKSEMHRIELRCVTEELERLRRIHVNVVAERNQYQAASLRCWEGLKEVEASRSEIQEWVRGIGDVYRDQSNRLCRQLDQIEKGDKELKEDFRKLLLGFWDGLPINEEVEADNLAEI